MSDIFSKRLNQALLDLGLPQDPTLVRKLLDYINQLQRWNRTYNLTALRDPDQMLVQHIFDSLSIVRPFQNYLAGRNQSAQESVRIVDVGSGAGPASTSCWPARSAFRPWLYS